MSLKNQYKENNYTSEPTYLHKDVISLLFIVNQIRNIKHVHQWEPD